MSRINWESLLWETRGYLGIDDTDPVPVEELREQAKANGYDEREVRKALRDTDALESLGDDPDDLRVRLTEESEKRENQAEHTPEDADPSDENPGGETDKPGSSNGRDALRDALEWFHQQLDRDLPEECPYATPGAYYREGRGWDADTIDEKLLGYAPATYKDDLIAHLFERGHEREAILGSGLFGERDDGSLYTTWCGRYVLPYFDAEGRPVFAISRATHPVHPADWKGNKYDKLPVSRDAVAIEEPIYGLDTVRETEPVLITEGIADAITAHQAGYACVSPVTTQFKKSDQKRVADALGDRGVSRVYLIQDAERPTSDLDDRERLTLQQFGDGVKGAVRTAAYLSTHGFEARIGDLPRPGLDKVDLDDYLQVWSDDLTPVLAGAKPVAQHPAYEPKDAKQAAVNAAEDSNPSKDTGAGGSRGSALFEVDIQDVTGLSDGFRGKNPLGHHGESENYFVVDDGVAIDFKYKAGYNALTYLLVAADERPPDAPNGSLDESEVFAAWRHAKDKRMIGDDDPIPRAALQHIADVHTEWDGDLVEHTTPDGDTFEGLPTDVYNAALEAVREEYDLDPGRTPAGAGGGPNTEPVAVLPQSVRDLSHATTGFDWRHTARQGPDTLTLDDARERTTDAIADAYQYGDRVLVEALPGMGKSYGAIKAAARTGEPVTILTGRGRKEQYGQFKDWCEKFGLSYYQLPSFTHDCDTANGEHGQEWEDTAREWYARGATPKEIHAHAEYELGRPLPCQAHDGQQCPYSSKWDFDPDDFDVLIGHPTHAYRENKVVSGRTVVFDEFPGAFETRLGTNLQGAVSYWLQSNDGVPFDDYTDLLENRSDDTRRADALLWFEEHGVEPDELSVFDDPNAYAAAPLAVFTILAANDLGNDFEYAEIDGVGTGVRNRENDGVSILQPPDLSYASSVVALDGTPTQDMWELSLGERLNHRAVLQDGEREEYLRDALNLNIVRTSEHIKPYNSKGHVHTESDAALLDEMKKAYDERPGLISSSAAISEYEDAGVLDLVDGTRHYGNVLGSNEFKEKRVGAVIGSNHYGDDFIQRWGAYAGEYVPGGDEAREGGEKRGADLSYGEFGDKILTHMREHDTLQAVMRFGRDGSGAVVYVHTDTLPEWVPIAGETRVTTTRSDGERAVISAKEDLGTATTEAIVEHPEVSLSRQQVFTHLERLRERGVLDREQDTEDGRRFVWKDDGLHRVNDHGEVELDPVELDELDDGEVRQVARSSIYTWNFTNRDDTDAVESGYAGPTGATPKTDADAGGDRPPDPAD